MVCLTCAVYTTLVLLADYTSTGLDTSTVIGAADLISVTDFVLTGISGALAVETDLICIGAFWGIECATAIYTDTIGTDLILGAIDINYAGEQYSDIEGLFGAKRWCAVITYLYLELDVFSGIGGRWCP
jgi:hypothetical protein